MPADLTKEEIAELERMFYHAKTSHVTISERLRFNGISALSLARAHLEGREAGGELTERLRAGASKSPDVNTHWRKYQALCDEAADALASYRAENERLAKLHASAAEDRKTLLDEANRLREERDEVVEALEPFSDVDGEGDEDFSENTVAAVKFGRTTYYGLKLGHFRHARTVYNNLTTGEQDDG